MQKFKRCEHAGLHVWNNGHQQYIDAVVVEQMLAQMERLFGSTPSDTPASLLAELKELEVMQSQYAWPLLRSWFARVKQLLETK